MRAARRSSGGVPREPGGLVGRGSCLRIPGCHGAASAIPHPLARRRWVASIFAGTQDARFPRHTPERFHALQGHRPTRPGVVPPGRPEGPHGDALVPPPQYPVSTWWPLPSHLAHQQCYLDAVGPRVLPSPVGLAQPTCSFRTGQAARVLALARGGQACRPGAPRSACTASRAAAPDRAAAATRRGFGRCAGGRGHRLPRATRSLEHFRLKLLTPSPDPRDISSTCSK